jgi:hypothetical protein
MKDSLGTERYCVCPSCRTKYAYPTGALEHNYMLQALEGEAPPAIGLRGVVYCGNCGTGFMPDIHGYAKRHDDEVEGTVHYLGGTYDSRPQWKRNRPASDVLCEVSGRWLHFHPQSSKLTAGEYIHVDVMTSIETESGSRERKLCTLVLTREDLMAALDKVSPR